MRWHMFVSLGENQKRREKYGVDNPIETISMKTIRMRERILFR